MLGDGSQRSATCAELHEESVPTCISKARARSSVGAAHLSAMPDEVLQRQRQPKHGLGEGTHPAWAPCPATNHLRQPGVRELATQRCRTPDYHPGTTGWQRTCAYNVLARTRVYVLAGTRVCVLAGTRV
jgi:hypothetical protein